jgi:hypothetical protein
MSEIVMKVTGSKKDGIMSTCILRIFKGIVPFLNLYLTI